MSGRTQRHRSWLSTHIRGHVVGYVALFFALTGVTWAAFAPPNSITSRNIRPQNVKSSDVNNNDLTGRDIKNGELTGLDIQQDSIAGFNVIESTLGSPLVRSPSIETQTSASDDVSPKTVTATCPGNRVALAGGVSVSGGSDAVALRDSAPVLGGTAPVGWTAQAYETSPVNAPSSWSITVHAVCVRA